MSSNLSSRSSLPSNSSSEDRVTKERVVALLHAARRIIYREIFAWPRPPITRVLEGNFGVRMTQQSCPQIFVIGNGKVPPNFLPSATNPMVQRGYPFWNFCGMTTWATITKLQEVVAPLGVQVEGLQVMPKAKMILLHPDMHFPGHVAILITLPNQQRLVVDWTIQQFGGEDEDWLTELGDYLRRLTCSNVVPLVVKMNFLDRFARGEDRVIYGGYWTVSRRRFRRNLPPV